MSRLTLFTRRGLANTGNLMVHVQDQAVRERARQLWQNSQLNKIERKTHLVSLRYAGSSRTIEQLAEQVRHSHQDRTRAAIGDGLAKYCGIDQRFPPHGEA